MKFQSNQFSFSKVIESSSWFGDIYSTLPVCKMKNETSFEIRAYIKGCLGLNASVSQIHVVNSVKVSFQWHKNLKVVVVVLLFYIMHGKHLRSYRDGQLT